MHLVIEKSGQKDENRVYWYSYCLNNPLKYTDPSGYSYQRFMEIFAMEQRDNQPSEFFNNYPKGWEGFQNFLYRGQCGDIGYHYNWETGVYTNKSGRRVSFEEVYYNFVLPNMFKELQDEVTDERTIEILDTTFYDRLKKLKIGFVFVRPNEVKSESDFIKILRKKLNSKCDIIWSNSFNIN